MQSEKLKAEHFTRVPLADIETPRTGRTCRANYWWAVTDENEVLFYHGGRKRDGTPQCNCDQRVVEHIVRLYDFPAHAVLVPVAFLPQRP